MRYRNKLCIIIIITIIIIIITRSFVIQYNFCF